MNSVLALVLLFSTSAFATNFNDCIPSTMSPELTQAIEDGIDKGVSRRATPFSYGYDIQSMDAPLLCELTSGQLTVASMVTVDFWNEDGDTGTKSDACFLTLEKTLGNVWVPLFISCDELGIEQKL